MKRLHNIFGFSRGKNLQENLGNYLKLVFIWCPIVTLLFIFGFSGTESFILRFSISMTIAVTVATSCFGGSLLIFYAYNFYLSRRRRQPKKETLLWGVLTSYPFLLPGLYLGFAFAARVMRMLGHRFTPPNFSDYSSGVIFGLMVSGMATLYEVIRQSKAAKQAAELKFQALENERLKAQVSALSAQLNPHLLFNSLNTIAATISSDPISAEDMIVKLSELYRGILKSAKGDMHSLENELELCKSYLEIEQKRFGPRIRYSIHVAPDINPNEISIPVLLLQPLVENSVKHGLSPMRAGGEVSISISIDETHLLLEVIDNGVGTEVATDARGTGTGLSNCTSRVQLKYGANSAVRFNRNQQNETVASISIPRQAL